MISNQRLRAFGASGGQEEQDRLFALLLQDQLFMQGVRENPALLGMKKLTSIVCPEFDCLSF